MSEETPKIDEDGIDRRGFLKCMAWAGTGLIFSVSGGVLRTTSLTDLLRSGAAASNARLLVASSSFNFVQISDSHIGFGKDANKDVIGTLQTAIDQINAADTNPELLIHTGDLSHLSKDSEFDAMDQVLKGVKAGGKFFVPGEHDVLSENGKNYRERYGKGTKGDGWYSFDHKGVHFVALVNVLNLKPGGFGSLGEDQLKWLQDDLKGLKDSAPIVVFAHVPLWTVYPDWGWGTDDGTRALDLLRRFGSVSVLNGHIHQIMQKVEGNITFHTARSTAFPQPAPGTAKSPGPMTVPADELRNMLGITAVKVAQNNGRLALIDSTLASPSAATKHSLTIQNFAYAPTPLTVKTGATVTWTNRDDMPHTVTDVNGRFKSPTLDTDDKWSHAFAEKGRFDYYCTIHPRMKGAVIVE